jgi:hypothetical protein
MTDPTRDRILANAGGLLLAAGGVAAFTGGMYGLAVQNPWLVVLSVALLMGYGVVGYLLMNRGRDFFAWALPASAVLVVLTLLLLQAARIMDDATTRYVLQPGLTLLLSFAGGALVTHAIEETQPRVRWPGRGAPSLNATLHLAAVGPIWGSFTLLDIVGPKTPLFRILLVGGAVLVSVACVVGAYAATREGHPRLTLFGSTLGFLACAALLFQFMLGPVREGATIFGELLALLGLVLTGLAGAISTVAWLQLAAGTPPAEEHRMDVPPPQTP